MKTLGKRSVLGFWVLLAGSVASANVAPAKVVPSTAVDTAGWELLGQDDGIATWKKEIEGSPIVAFRGEAEIPGSVAKVAQVLSDTSRKTEWVHNAVEVKDLKLISDHERIEYNHTGTPFILKDRDFVFHATTQIEPLKKQVVVSIKSIEHPDAPDTGRYVRGKLMNSRYILTALGPARTRVLVEIHADPMGSVAKWIVNLFQKAWPRNTLDGIRKQVAKPDVIEHPRVKAAFALGG
jgi:hypothetical protein